jgi:hypothetical protein
MLASCSRSLHRTAAVDKDHQLEPGSEQSRSELNLHLSKRKLRIQGGLLADFYFIQRELSEPSGPHYNSIGDVT